MGRINAWWVAWHTALAYPLGGGMSFQHDFLFERYGPYEQGVRAAHSIYFEILGNHGFLGLFLFVMIWVSAYFTAGWLRKNTTDIPEAQWAGQLGAMVQVSLVGYLVGGAFLSLPYFDLPYNLVLMVVLARAWVLKRRWETDPVMPFLEYAGLRKPRRGKPTKAGPKPAAAPNPAARGLGTAPSNR
jgi:probable O-glycosylation ligase (exosortase A-associated)